MINSPQPDSSVAEWSCVFSVSVEEDLLTWVFPFCKPYLTPSTEEGWNGVGSDGKEKIRLMLKNVPYCVAWLPKWVARF